MQTNIPRSEFARRARIRRVMPGFPAKPFATIDEVEAHLGGEKIVCMMCGKEYENLLRHVAATHHMDGHDYRQRFNIPAKYSLAGASLSEKRRAVGKRPEHAAQIAAQRARHPRTGPRSSLIPHDWHKPKYDDFSWHLEQARTVYERREPPPGVASWSAFAKRCASDPELRAAFKIARAERPVSNSARCARLRRNKNNRECVVAGGAQSA